MAAKSQKPISLLPRLLLSTSIALTLLFAATGWILQRHVISMTQQTLGDETSAAFKAYQSLWQSRAKQLASTSLILSNMKEVFDRHSADWAIRQPFRTSRPRCGRKTRIRTPSSSSPTRADG